MAKDAVRMKSCCRWVGRLILAVLMPAAAATGQVRLSVDAARTTAPISKYVYGQFAEHLGRSIYGGLWA
jgi:alpha-N-arabinofuranosidase